MDRRESLKMLLLAALGGRAVCPEAVAAQGGDGKLEAPLGGRPSSTSAPRARAAFTSRWSDWRDMRWAGPEYWGNRLQDWIVRDGRVVCRTRGPNRTLHCLTHTVQGGTFTTRVHLRRPELQPGRTSDAAAAPDASRFGVRFGVSGRFPGVRSAAVHGEGVDAGVDRSGVLHLGDVRSSGRVSGEGPVLLVLRSTESGGMAQVVLEARSDDGETVLAHVEASHRLDRVLGNVALLSHMEPDSGDSGAGDAATFADWTIEGADVVEDAAQAFGPIMFAQYTLHRGTLKLTAQLAPMDGIDGVEVALDVRSGGSGSWSRTAEAPIDPLARTARFRLEGWDSRLAAEYRVRVTLPLRSGPVAYDYLGGIAAEPSPEVPLKAAVFSCNADHGFPDAEVVQHVAVHGADLAVFLGDQFYEGNGGFGIQRGPVEESALDMLHKWYMFGWSYRETFRDIPAVFLPDDHDVYHGNVWGEGGKAAPTDSGWGAAAQDQGGYKMPPAWVNAVQRAQTSHLPDPFDPTPVDQGIGVYYTAWTYGGVSFALLEDRKFKSAPANVLPPEAQVLNGWIQNPDFDVRDHPDPAGAELLGERQMRFLEAWIGDWSGSVYQKVVLSQTNFAAVHTIPSDAMSGAVLPGLPMPAPGEYVEGDKLAADMDSNGWPRARRDEVLRILRRGAAFHIAGDQHLATVVRHGIDTFDDAGFSFTGPALNNIWPRRWWPPRDLREAPLPGGGPDYTGRFIDGFGNRITVHASANPRATGLEPALIRDRVTGYGIVTFDRGEGSVTIECWPRHVDPLTAGGATGGQYEGWPIVVRTEEGDGRTPVGFLPTLRIEGLRDPVVEVRTAEGELVYVRRIVGQTFRPPIFEAGPHSIRVGDPDADLWQERRGVQPVEDGSSLVVRMSRSLRRPDSRSV
jgi:hypothetical protein